MAMKKKAAKKHNKVLHLKADKPIKLAPASEFKAHPAKVKTATGKKVVADETTSNQPQFADLPSIENHEHKYIRGTLPGNRLIKVCRYFGCGHTIMDISQDEFDALR